MTRWMLGRVCAVRKPCMAARAGGELLAGCREWRQPAGSCGVPGLSRLHCRTAVSARKHAEQAAGLASHVHVAQAVLKPPPAPSLCCQLYLGRPGWPWATAQGWGRAVVLWVAQAAAEPVVLLVAAGWCTVQPPVVRVVDGAQGGAPVGGRRAGSCCTARLRDRRVLRQGPLLSRGTLVVVPWLLPLRRPATRASRLLLRRATPPAAAAGSTPPTGQCAAARGQ